MMIQNVSQNSKLMQPSGVSLNKQEAKNTVSGEPFGKAATAQISDMAKKLRENAAWEQGKGEATKELEATQVVEHERIEKKDRASELERKLKDSDLTEDDKQSLKDEIATLKEEAKSPQDKVEESMAGLDDKIATLMKRKESATPEEMAVINTQMEEFRTERSDLQRKQSQMIKDRYGLGEKSRIETAEQLVKKRRDESIPSEKDNVAAGSADFMKEQLHLIEEQKKKDELLSKEASSDDEGTKETAAAEGTAAQDQPVDGAAK